MVPWITGFSFGRKFEVLAKIVPSDAVAVCERITLAKKSGLAPGSTAANCVAEIITRNATFCG